MKNKGKNKKEKKVVKNGGKRLAILLPLDLVTRLVLLFAPHNVITFAISLLEVIKIETAAIIYLVENIIISIINLYLYIDALKGQKLKTKTTYFSYVICAIVVTTYLEILHFISVTD